MVLSMSKEMMLMLMSFVVVVVVVVVDIDDVDGWCWWWRSSGFTDTGQRIEFLINCKKGKTGTTENQKAEGIIASDCKRYTCFDNIVMHIHHHQHIHSILVGSFIADFFSTFFFFCEQIVCPSACHIFFFPALAFGISQKATKRFSIQFVINFCHEV